MPSRPLATIGIPTYNNVTMLREAVASALEQTYRPLEIVVCDNASTDDTQQMMEAIEDPRLRYIRNETNLGMVGNFRRVLTESKGKYICFLGSDDLVEPEFVAWGVDALEGHPQARFAFAGVRFVGARQGTQVWDFSTILYGEQFILESLQRAQNLAFLCGTLAQRDWVEKIGIEDQTFFDWTLWLRLASHGDAAYTPKLLAQYRYHNSNETKLSMKSHSQHLQELSNSLLTYLNKEQPDDATLRQAVDDSLDMLFFRYTDYISRDKMITWNMFSKELRNCWRVPISWHVKLKYIVRSLLLRRKNLNSES